MPASGNIAAVSASTPIRSRCAGPAATGSPRSRSGSALSNAPTHWNDVADRLHAALMEQAWNPKREAFTAAFGSDDLDASVLLLPELGVVEADDPRFVSTVAAMERELSARKARYALRQPPTISACRKAFLICRFWLIDAWWALGPPRRRATFRRCPSTCNRYGLLAEHIHLQNRRITLGNFPQTYSMAGLILTGMSLSRSWEDRYWRS